MAQVAYSAAAAGHSGTVGQPAPAATAATVPAAYVAVPTPRSRCNFASYSLSYSLFFSFSTGEQWKNQLHLPQKDLRTKTEVRGLPGPHLPRFRNFPV